MSTYDPESLLNDIKTFISDNLNTKLSAIDTEKGDGITLTQVDSSAYFMDMDDQLVNYDPFVLYFIADSITESYGGATKEDLVINVSLVFSGNNLSDITKIMLRYRRALKEVIQDKFQRHHDNLKIQALPPLEFQREGETQVYKVVSLNIITSIG